MRHIMRTGAAVFALVLANSTISCSDSTDAGPPPATIELAADSVFYGKTINASVALRDSTSLALTSPFEWASSDTSVAVVDSDGRILGTGVGTAIITASHDASTADSRAVMEVSRTIRTVLRRADNGVSFGNGSIGNFGECALTASGAAYCRRMSFATDVAEFYAPLPGSTSISLRSLFTALDSQCGMTSDGRIFCWGRNAHFVFASRLPNSSADAPVQVKTDIRFKSMMTAGHSSICAIRIEDDVLYCWGHNDSYQLGREPSVQSDSNVAPVSGNLRAKMVSGSDIGACALDVNGGAWCWGGASETALGVGAGSNTHIPNPVVGGMTFNTITAGNTHQCALVVSGEAYCWGSNANGELGIATMSAASGAGPQRVAGNLRFSLIATTNQGNASEEGTCGITTEGDLYCWGLFEPAVIHERIGTRSASPYQIAPGQKFRALSRRYGYDSMCAITTDGHAVCW
jgi:alpha-tubulin suppressor-like RCC1 family protein